MWTNENRAKYDRDHLRYPSDLTDDEWAHVAPLIPPAKRGGAQTRDRHARSRQRPDVRAEHRLPMALCSEGFAAAQHAAIDTFDWWTLDGTLDRIHDALYVKCREQAEREASPPPASSIARA